MKKIDVAKELGTTKFQKLHPISRWPDWMHTLPLWGMTPVDGKNKWKYSITVPVGKPLESNERWKKLEDGSTIMIAKDPNTGEERVVIGKEADYNITIFEALVNVENNKIDVSIDNDPASVKIPPEAWWGNY
jgi:hypothetical protein